MTRDPRPVLVQVKSGFKIAGILVVVSAALLVLASYLPTYRIRAWVLHWKHGNSVQVGEFTIPVPNEWVVESFEVAGGNQEFQLVYTKSNRTLWAMITIVNEPWRRNIALADFTNSRRRMMENTGIHVIETRQLAIAGTSGSCLDGETAMTGIPVRNISCYLGTSLSVEYVGNPLIASSFYSILGGVSRSLKN
jgi:hypothetical protein